ncbi:hypothetical protein N431DRAFT_462320 [Stipitochalara longipes BDJ]|nr:hypothetical protein N431DRAFT_462320 [Stipitochalara longipes BDJ]
MKLYVFLATLVVAVTATDFTCAKDEVAVCCRAQTDDFSKCTAAELESDDFNGDGTNAPDYYCSSRRFARCCDSGAEANNVYKTIVIGPQTGVLSYAFTLTAKGGASTAPPTAPTGISVPVTISHKCKDVPSDDSKRRRKV